MADNSILMRLDGLKIKYEEVGQKLTDPEVIADVKAFVQYTKEYKELEPIIETSERYRKALSDLADAKDILANEKDEDFREMARAEVAELEPAIAQMEEDIKLLLIPKDPQDAKNAVLEIRGGTGGDEAALFAGDLMRMYTKYIESKGWRYEITSFSEGAVGGYLIVKEPFPPFLFFLPISHGLPDGVHAQKRFPAERHDGRHVKHLRKLRDRFRRFVGTDEILCIRRIFSFSIVKPVPYFQKVTPVPVRRSVPGRG